MQYIALLLLTALVPGQHCHITDQCLCEFLVGSGDDNRPFYDIWPGLGDIVSVLLPEMTFPPVVRTLIPMVLTFLSAGIMFSPTVINILPTVRMCPAMMMILVFCNSDDYLTCSVTFSPLSSDGYLLTETHYDLLLIRLQQCHAH